MLHTEVMQTKKSKLVMEKLKKTLERLFWKRRYIIGLERKIEMLKADYNELAKKLKETEQLNRGLTSDLMSYKKKCKNTKKGGKQ